MTESLKQKTEDIHEFIRAVFSLDTDKVLKSLSKSVDINVKTTSQEDGILHRLCDPWNEAIHAKGAKKKKVLKMIDFLIDHGADVNQQSRYGGTALNAAAIAGNADVVLHLRQRGAIVDYNSTCLKEIQYRILESTDGARFYADVWNALTVDLDKIKEKMHHIEERCKARQEKLESKKLPKVIKEIGKAGIAIDSKIEATVAIKKAQKEGRK